jgi:hypothetical protein
MYDSSTLDNIHDNTHVRLRPRSIITDRLHNLLNTG